MRIGRVIFADISIKIKFILGIVLILAVTTLTLSVVFIRQSENLLIASLEDKANLLNRNFSIVSAKGIQESSFSNLQSLINEVSVKDREIKLLVVAYSNGMIIATSDKTKFRQFSKISNDDILRHLEKKEDSISRDKNTQSLKSIRLIYSFPDEQSDENDEEPQTDHSKTAASPAQLLGFIYIELDTAYLEKSVSDLWKWSILIAFVMIGAGIAGAYGVATAISGPIGLLAAEVRVIASGNWTKSIQPKSRDEIGQLVSDVEKMRLSIIALTENLKGQERLKHEMALARRIQTSLLPNLTANVHRDFEIAAAMVPADQVGGDFYDVTYDRAGHLWFAVGDVSGHGVTPGLIMMMAQTIHTSVTASVDCDARELVVKLNEILYKNVHERLNENHFMTFTALKYLGDGHFQYAGAHLSMIVFRQKTGDCEFIRTRGVYLNFKSDISKATKNDEFSLDAGDFLVLYTDGLTEAENTEGKMLDLDGFVNIVKNYADQPSKVMKDMIMNEVIRWCDDKRNDDMTLVIIKRKENS
ncbi:MAG: hypothetical protein BWK80_21060 [Desulfobacteraceae bacterium IS3]|nr:MAG: hypothetical protein BWK80_21060 [Desulfobacteraceae bacterium IS3]